MKAITLFDTIQPGVALTPDSGVTPSRNPYFVPDSAERRAVVLIGARIDRLGTHISPKFASRYFNEILTAVHPYVADTEPFPGLIIDWLRDSALIVSDAVPKSFAETDVLERLDEAIVAVSRFTTLKTGDIVLLPTSVPAYGPLTEGSNIMISPNTAGFPLITLKVR